MAVMSLPWNSTLPFVGVSNRLMQRSGVDLPLPDAPMMQVVARVDSKVHHAKQHGCQKLLERWRTSITGTQTWAAPFISKILGLMVRVRGIVHAAGVGQQVSRVQVVVLRAVQRFPTGAAGSWRTASSSEVNDHDDGRTFSRNRCTAHRQRSCVQKNRSVIEITLQNRRVS